MKIELHRITIRELVEGYVDDAERGVRAYGGRLDVRPAYQREFVYKEKERDAVVTTVMRGFPLNVMYWVRKPDGSFEVMDGQQRTISICQYFNGDFSWGEIGAVGGLGAKFFHRQPEDVREKFLDYELMVYFCEGTESEKIDWFKVINIAGLKLTDQEMRNAVYAGPWVTDAKRYFSRPGCVAAKIGAKYLNRKADRQEYLEEAIVWAVNSARDRDIEAYMAVNQGREEATDLWLHFQKVVNWVETLFPHYRKEMKGLEWGRLYAEFGGGRGATALPGASTAVYDMPDTPPGGARLSRPHNPVAMEEEIAALMADREVQKKSGIYEYLLSGRTRPEKLNLRQFEDEEKREAYERQTAEAKARGASNCPLCAAKGLADLHAYEEMQGDHIVPWSKGGKTVPENLQMLCARCNAAKGAHGF